MALRKDPASGVWFVDFTIGGKRYKKTTKTKLKGQAQEIHDRLKAEIWQTEIAGRAPQETFEIAAVLYLRACDGQRDYASKERHIDYFRDYFAGQPLEAITPSAIEDALPKHKIVNGRKEPMATATQNRYLATIGKLLRDAHKRGSLAVMPHIKMKAESPIKEEFLTMEQAGKLLDNMRSGWVKDASEFALCTGMRAGEILTLEWAQVNLETRLVSVLASKAKNGRSRAVPLNDNAVEVIERRKDTHKRLVFAPTKESENPATQIDKRVFKPALKAAGLPEHFRFHDLRHAWASAHCLAGTPLLTLQRLGGWQSVQMLNRYAHLAAQDLHQFVNAVQIQSRFRDAESEPKLKIVKS